MSDEKTPAPRIEKTPAPRIEKTPAPAPRIEKTPASPELEVDPGSAVLPGEHQGGFQRLPTAPLDVPATDAGPDDEPEPLAGAEWTAPAEVHHGGMSGWALGLAVVALGASFFVGWTFPLGIAGAIVAIVALRRPWDSRVVAGWALALSILSVAYSAGWILWLVGQGHVFG